MQLYRWPHKIITILLALIVTLGYYTYVQPFQIFTQSIDAIDVTSVTLRGGITKNSFFFRKTPKGGGRGLAESEISFSEKTDIFLEFFLKEGGGPTYSKRVLS